MDDQMTEQEEEMTEDEALLKLAQAMKDNAPTPEDRQSVHTFLHNIAIAKNTTKTGNLRDDKDMNELGVPLYTVRGARDMALISDEIMDNKYFKRFFKKDAEITLSTSLSREGFLVRQGTTQTKQVADITKRRTINKGWFGKQKIQEQGGDTTGSN
jgi:hypothetical protein